MMEFKVTVKSVCVCIAVDKDFLHIEARNDFQDIPLKLGAKQSD